MKNLKYKQLRKTSNLIGFSFVLEVALANFLYIFLRSKNFTGENKTIVEILINIVSFTLPYLLLLFVLSKNFKDVVPIKKPKNNPLFYIGLGFGIETIVSVLTEYLMRFLTAKNLSSATPKELFQYENSVGGIILYLISLSVVPALVEEFVCRGVFLGLLKPFGNKFAIFISALMFGLMHGNVEQFISAFLIGLYMAFLTLKTESLWPAITLHFFNNFTKGIFVVFSDLNNKDFVLSYYNIILIVSLLSFIYLFFVNKGRVFHIKEEKSKEISTLKKLRDFVFTPGMILFFVYVMFMFYNSFKIL